jgi:hypothetical protein
MPGPPLGWAQEEELRVAPAKSARIKVWAEELVFMGFFIQLYASILI